MQNTQMQSAKEILTLTDRTKLCVGGVKNVISYYDEAVSLELYSCNLEVDGRELNITRLELDKGEVEISGFVTGLNYTGDDGVAAGKQKPFIRRLFS